MTTANKTKGFPKLPGHHNPDNSDEKTDLTYEEVNDLPDPLMPPEDDEAMGEDRETA